MGDFTHLLIGFCWIERTREVQNQQMGRMAHPTKLYETRTEVIYKGTLGVSVMNPSAGTSAGLDKDRLAEIVRRLVAALSPRAIYLFGSRLYGAPTADSDIDILVLVSDGAPSAVELARQGYACLHGLGLPVELHFAGESKFERFSTVVGSFHREVKQRGRVLYAA